MTVEASDTGVLATSARRDAGGSVRGRAAVAGVLGSAVALGVSELAAGLSTQVPSLIVAVGATVIDGVPPAVKDLAIAAFGVYDKVALVIGMLLIAAVSGAALGRLAASRFWVGAVGFGGFGLIGLWAASRDPRAAFAPMVAATALAAAAGVAALAVLLARGVTVPAATPPPRPRVAAEPIVPRGDRRQFLRLATGMTAAAAVTAAGGRLLTRRAAASVARTSVVLPRPATPLASPPDAASLNVDGITPLFTPNDAFFRIDTALSVPRVDPAGWRLAVTGMVDRPLSLSYDELLAMPQTEVDVTLLCVSNEVGGNLAGNARWSGVPLAGILERAGKSLGATQVVGRSVDGWTSGFPSEAALDGRDALVAVGMNGEPLPLRHGFPARLVVPGLYGYVSATKWLTEIELTTWDGFDAYWVPRGWAKEGPIKTQSRIDVPRGGSTVPVGQIAVAGVAWGGLRGVERVEVSVDGGPWQEAHLADRLGAATWRQWVWRWQARRGRHLLAVRATDGQGAVQTARTSRPAPDGATGHHTVRIDVA